MCCPARREYYFTFLNIMSIILKRLFHSLQCFWALGACFEVALALAVGPNLGWRWLLGLSAAPLFAFAVITPVSISQLMVIN